MGSVLRFPDSRGLGRAARADRHEGATVVILPVIRIERDDGKPAGDTDTPGSPRKRRRRDLRP